MDVVTLGMAKADTKKNSGLTLYPSGLSDHTTMVNAALSALASTTGKKRLTLMGAFTISAPLVVHSDTTLDVTNGSVTLASGSNCNMLQSSAHAPLRTVTDGVATAASTTVTSATAAFTSADVGRNISIAGAGTAVGQGGIKNLYTTIVSVESATSVTVALAAITTVSAASLSIYKREKNIKVIGGYWNRQDNAGTDTGKHAICIRRVDNLVLSDMEHYSTQPAPAAGKYGINVGDVTNFVIERITAPNNVQADLIHVNGPASKGVIRNIYGYSTDDFVSLTAVDYAAYSDVSGPITDIDINNVQGDCGAAVMVKMCSSLEQSAYLDRIRVRNVARLGNDTVFKTVMFASDCGTLDARDITFDNLQGRILTDRGTIKSLTVTNSRLTQPVNSYHLIDLVGTYVKTLNISNVSNALTATSLGSLVLLEPYTGGVVAKIDTLNIANVDWEINAGYLISMNTQYAQIKAVKMTNVRHYCPAGGGGLFTANVAGATLTDVYMNNVETNNSAWIADTAVTTKFWLNGFKAVGAFRVRATGNVTVTGAGISTNGTITADAGGVVRSLTSDFSTDISKLTKANGDKATNTNAALACGAGLVISDGTNWKNLYTGVTY